MTEAGQKGAARVANHDPTADEVKEISVSNSPLEDLPQLAVYGCLRSCLLFLLRHCDCWPPSLSAQSTPGRTAWTAASSRLSLQENNHHLCYDSSDTGAATHLQLLLEHNGSCTSLEPLFPLDLTTGKAVHVCVFTLKFVICVL